MNNQKTYKNPTQPVQMNAEKEKLLRLANGLPGRLSCEQTAWILGFEAHEIPILISVGLLRPLGHPPVNGGKFFDLDEVERLRHDAKWKARASDAIVQHWRRKNGRKINNREVKQVPGFQRVDS